MIENFMTSWTSLVGDPIISKWIVLILAVSVALNGYLLKGIAAGGLRGLQPQAVRFRSIGGGGMRAQEKQQEEEAALVEVQRPVQAPVVVYTPPPATQPQRRPALVAPVAKPAGAQFTLSTIDDKLRRQAAMESGSSDSSDGEPDPKPMRTFNECLDIFENGPRPVSVSLSILTDEEVIMLAQNGKIAAYNLEKVLGDLERAVLVRRALICE